MSTFWVSDAEFAREVPLQWSREARGADGTDGAGQNGGAAGEVERDAFYIESASWRQKQGHHYLTFVEPGMTGAEQGQPSPRDGQRSILRLSPDGVTWMRFGEVAWSHTFRAGETSSSTLRVSGFALDVEARTQALTVSVSESGGRVHLSYLLRMAGQNQLISLLFQFGAEAADLRS